MRAAIKDSLRSLRKQPDSAKIQAEIKKQLLALSVLDAFESQMLDTLNLFLDGQSLSLIGQVILAKDKADKALTADRDDIGSVLDMVTNMSLALAEARDSIIGIDDIK